MEQINPELHESKIKELEDKLGISNPQTKGGVLVDLLEQSYKELSSALGISLALSLKKVCNQLLLKEAFKLVTPTTTVCFDKKVQPLVVGKPIVKAGGQAELKKVHATWDQSLCYALKEFSLDRLETFKSVRAEMNNLKQLNHDHCAKLLGSYFIRDEPFYSFCILLPWYEFSLENLYKNDQVQGIPSNILTELRNLNFVVTTIDCLVNAVNYLHNVVKIKHLDLKPPNILFKKEDDSYILKLCDFGISSAFSKDSLGKSPTFGTEFYQSPEQVANQPARSSDIYSLGVVIFEFLVWCEGQKPGVLRGGRGFGKSIASQDLHRVEIFFNALVISNLNAFSQLVFSMLNHQASARPSIGSVCHQVSTIGKNLGVKPHCEENLQQEVPEDFVRPAYEEPDNQDEPPLQIRELFEKGILKIAH